MVSTQSESFAHPPLGILEPAAHDAASIGGAAMAASIEPVDVVSDTPQEA